MYRPEETYQGASFEAIADYLRTSLFPTECLQSQHILLRLYRCIAKGAPVSIGELGAQLGLDESTIQHTLSEVDPSRLQYDEGGCIVGFAGLGQTPSQHSFLIEGQQLYTWCIWDALFLPSLLGKLARVKTKCPVSGQEISFLATLQGVEQVQPDTVMMSFVTPDSKNLCGNLRGAFCNHVNLFASAEIARSWQTANPHASIITLDEAFRLGTVRNEAGLGLALRDEKRS